MTSIERASARASVRAANDNAPSRKEMLRIADQIIEANPETREPEPRVRYRGTRPAWNWLKKKDAVAAASLWLFARERLPSEADNDNEPTAGMSAERRKDGKARGRNPDPRSIEAYLAMPGVRMRFGDAETPRMKTDGWHSDVITIKPQRKPGDYPLQRRADADLHRHRTQPTASVLPRDHGRAGGVRKASRRHPKRAGSSRWPSSDERTV